MEQRLAVALAGTLALCLALLSLPVVLTRLRPQHDPPPLAPSASESGGNAHPGVPHSHSGGRMCRVDDYWYTHALRSLPAQPGGDGETSDSPSLHASSSTLSNHKPCGDPAVCLWKHDPALVDRTLAATLQILHPSRRVGNARNPCWEVFSGENQVHVGCLPAFFVIGMPKAGTTVR